jgi:hypothetical protein
VYPPKSCMHLSCVPHVLHAPPISFFLISSPYNIWQGVQSTKLLDMQCSTLPCYVAPLRHKFLPHHPILEHTLSLRSFLNVRHQVPHPYKTHLPCQDRNSKLPGAGVDDETIPNRPYIEGKVLCALCPRQGSV